MCAHTVACRTDREWNVIVMMRAHLRGQITLLDAAAHVDAAVPGQLLQLGNLGSRSTMRGEGGMFKQKQ